MALNHYLNQCLNIIDCIFGNKLRWSLVVVAVVSFISDRLQQWCKNRKKINKYQYLHDIETLLHSLGGHQGSRKAKQTDNQRHVAIQVANMGLWGLIVSWNFKDTLTLFTVIYVRTTKFLSSSAHTVHSRYIVVIYLLKISQKTPHSSPMRARYGVSFANAKTGRSCIIVNVFSMSNIVL